MSKQCSVEGCEKWAIRKGMCQPHHDKMRRHGDPLYVRPQKNTGECKIEGCKNPAYKKEMCNPHYIRMRRFGRTGRLLAPAGSGTITSTGYRAFGVGKGKISEHRLIVEKYLDRKLESHEVIHHINGDRLDNRIENLEITTHALHRAKHPSAMKGKKHTAEAKALNSEAKKKWFQENPHPMLGKHHTDETKAKLRAAKLGKPRGKAHPLGFPDINKPLTGHTKRRA